MQYYVWFLLFVAFVYDVWVYRIFVSKQIPYDPNHLKNNNNMDEHGHPRGPHGHPHHHDHHGELPPVDLDEPMKVKVDDEQEELNVEYDGNRD
jgi:hypothetical protein